MNEPTNQNPIVIKDPKNGTFLRNFNAPAKNFGINPVSFHKPVLISVLPAP
jgi:hypothetical protein